MKITFIPSESLKVIGDLEKYIPTLKDRKYTIEIKEYRENRSLDANSYFWVLCGKLATALKIPAREIYREYIKDIGDNFEIIPVRLDAKSRWIRNWEGKGIGWICEDLGASKLDGYTNIKCYYGSSTYDSLQMSCLIELVVQDCKIQGIETMTPQQLEAIKSAWTEK